jgi:4'-phosphopantetheinyl transferase
MRAKSSSEPLLAPADVHVWRVWLDRDASSISGLTEVLSADERERAARFRFERDYVRYVAARASLRSTLAVYLRLPPERVQFTYGPHGKPALPKGELSFNLSHSQGQGLIAIALGRPVGVDLELVRPFEEADGVSEAIFSRVELGQFRALDRSEREPAFFSAWTRKEAYVKATGMGFSTNVAGVEVTFAPAAPPRLISLHGDVAVAANWTLLDLSNGDYAAALAVPGQVQRVVHDAAQPPPRS